MKPVLLDTDTARCLIDTSIGLHFLRNCELVMTEYCFEQELKKQTQNDTAAKALDILSNENDKFDTVSPRIDFDYSKIDDEDLGDKSIEDTLRYLPRKLDLLAAACNDGDIIQY